MRVLVTRAPNEAERFRAVLSAAGHEVLCVAVTERIAATTSELAALHRALKSAAHVAVASAHAARIVAEFGEIQAQMWAVGERTAEPLRRAVTVAEQADAQGLAEELIAARAQEVVWVGARDGRTEGIIELENAGIAVTVCPAYGVELIAAPDLSCWSSLDAVTVLAPSQVRALALQPVTRTVPLVAIGHTTADEARFWGFNVFVAARPTPEAVADALAQIPTAK